MFVVCVCVCVSVSVFVFTRIIHHVHVTCEWVGMYVYVNICPLCKTYTCVYIYYVLHICNTCVHVNVNVYIL